MCDPLTRKPGAAHNISAPQSSSSYELSDSILRLNDVELGLSWQSYRTNNGCSLYLRLLLNVLWPSWPWESSGGFIVMTVTTHHTADTVILRCQGRLVRGEESSLLCAAVQEHGKNVVVDLEGVTAIDAAGIGALLSLQAAGIYLKLMNPTEPVRAALTLTGLEKVFEVVCQQSSEDGE